MNVGSLLTENDDMTESGDPDLVNSLLDEDNSKHHLFPIHCNEDSAIELKDTDIFDVDEINEEDFDVNSSNTITVIRLAPVIDCGKNTIVEDGDFTVGELTVTNVLKSSLTHVTQKRVKEEFQSGNSGHLDSDHSHSGTHVISEPRPLTSHKIWQDNEIRDPRPFTSHKIWQDNEDPGENNQANNRTNTVLTNSIEFHSAGNNMAASFIINKNMPVHINSHKLMNSDKASGSIKEENTGKSEISRKRFRSRGKSSSFSSTETILKSKNSREKGSSNLQQVREGLNSYDNNFQVLMKTNNTHITTKNPASNLHSRRSRSTCNNKKGNEFQDNTENYQPGPYTCVKELGKHKERINTKFSYQGSNSQTAKIRSMKRNPFNSRTSSSKLKSSTRTDINFHNLEVGERNQADSRSYKILRNGKRVYCKRMKILDVNNCKLLDSYKVAGSKRKQNSHFSEIKKNLRSYKKSTNSSLTLKIKSEPDDSQECNSSDSDHLNKRVRNYDHSTLQLSIKSLTSDSLGSNLCSRKLVNDTKKEHNKLSGSENIGAGNNLFGPETCNEKFGEHKERINNTFSLKKNNSKITKHRNMKRNLTISRLYYKKLKRIKRSDRTSPTIEKYNQADNRSCRMSTSKNKVHYKEINMLQENKDCTFSHKVAGKVQIRHGKSSNFSSTVREIKLKNDPGDRRGSTGQLKERLKLYDNNGSQFLMNNYPNTTIQKPVVDSPASNLRSMQLTNYIKKKHKLLGNEFQEIGSYRILRSRSKVHSKGMNMLQESKGIKLSHSGKIVSRVKQHQPDHSGIRESLRSYGKSSNFSSIVREIKLMSDPHDSQGSTGQPNEKLKINDNSGSQFSLDNCSNTTTVKPAVDILAPNLHSRQLINSTKKKLNKILANEFQQNGSYRILRSRSKVHCKGMNKLQVCKDNKLSHSDRVVSRVNDNHPDQSTIKERKNSSFSPTVREMKLNRYPDDSQGSTGQMNEKLKINDNSGSQFSLDNCSNTTTVKPAVDILAPNLHSRQLINSTKKKLNKILANEFQQNRSYRILRSRSKVHCKGMNKLQVCKDNKLSHSDRVVSRVNEHHPDQSRIRERKNSSFSPTVREMKLKRYPDDSQGSTGQMNEKLKINDNDGCQFSVNNSSNTTTVKSAVDSLVSNLHSRQSTNNIEKKHKLLENEFQENGSYRILRSRSKVHCKGMSKLQVCKDNKLSHSDRVVSRVNEHHPDQSRIRERKSSSFSPKVREIKLKRYPDGSRGSTGQINEKLKINDNDGSRYSVNNNSNTTTVKSAVDGLVSNLHSRQSINNIKKKHNKLLGNEFQENGSYRILRSRGKVHCKGKNKLQVCKENKLSHSDSVVSKVNEHHPDQSRIRESLRSYGKSSSFSSTVREIKLKKYPDDNQGSTGQMNDNNGSWFSVNNSSNTTTAKSAVDSLVSNLHRQSINNIKKKHNKLIRNDFQENGSYRILRSGSKVYCKGMNILQIRKDSKLSHSDKVASGVKEQDPHQSGIRKSLRCYGKSSIYSPTVREIKLKSDPNGSQESSSVSDLLSERLERYDKGSHFSVESSNSNTTAEILEGDSPASNLRSGLSKTNIEKEHTELSGNEFLGSIENIQPRLEIFNELEKHKRTTNTKFPSQKFISTVNDQSMTESQPISRAHYLKQKSNLKSKYNVPVLKVKGKTGKERTLRSSCKVYSDRINIKRNNGKLLYLHKAANGVNQNSPDNCGIRESFKSNGHSSNFSSILTEDNLKSNPDDSQKHSLSDSEQLKKRLSYDNNSSQFFMQCKESNITNENTLAESPSSDVQIISRNIGHVNCDSSGITGKNVYGNKTSSNILPGETENKLGSNLLDDQQRSFSDSVIFHKHDRSEVSQYLAREKLQNNPKDDYEALDSPRSSMEEISNENSIDNCTGCIISSDTSNETSSVNKNYVEDEIIEYDTTSSSFEANNSECNSEENSSESNTNNQLEYDGAADDQRQTCSRSEAQEDNTLGSGRLVKLETRSGYVVTLTVDQDRPSQFRDDKARQMWDRAMDVNMARMMAQIETGQYLSDEVQKQIEEQRLARELEKDEMEKKLKWYQVEASMLDVDVKIKSCLNESTSPHKVDQCLNHLETLYNLNIQPLMLKKFSFVLDTIRALQRYVGSEEGVQLREREKFKKKAERIRSKANDIYKKFKNLYPAPENENFSDVFASILEAFQAETQNIDVYSLVEDPQSAEE